MPDARQSAVSKDTKSKLTRLQKLAEERKLNLRPTSSNASSDILTPSLSSNRVVDQPFPPNPKFPIIIDPSPVPAPESKKPIIQKKPIVQIKPVNPELEVLRLTPKRRASIVIERKAAPKRQPDRLPAGELVNVNNKTYKIECEIGSGGSCLVYRALEQTQNGQHVALKVVDLASAGKELTKVFKNEIQFLQKLQDSNYVIKMFDHQQVSNKLYVVMELGERNFKEQIKIFKDSGRLNDGMLRFLWGEMLSCVKVIHDLNIVHADLKPANFVLVKNMVKLIDFGIAAQIVTNENTVYRKGVQGTLNYISPEAVSCRPNGDGYEIPLKSDVWSLGCILYAFTYGEPPFAHITKQEKKIAAIMHDEVVYPKKSINPQLLDVLKRCLTRDLAKRPSVDELLRHPYVNYENLYN